MSDPEGAAGSPVDPTDEETDYKPPAEKSLNDILSQDKDDQSLETYKKILLGDAAEGSDVLAFPNDPRQVIVTKLVLLVPDRDNTEMDLTQDLAAIKKMKFVIKEGVKFQLRIDFFVQREIVTGLKYTQKTSRAGIPVDKMNMMVGSYAPKATAHSYTTPVDEAPSGMMGRGTYSVSSLFTDDDKKEHLKWEWTLEVKKDWASEDK